MEPSTSRAGGSAARAFLLLAAISCGACAGFAPGAGKAAGEKDAQAAAPTAEEARRYPKSGVMVVAHRGFRARAPENTLASAGKAFEAGAEWWELDVAASSDGTLVVLHDDTLLRTTDAKLLYPDRKPWSVYDFSREELSRLDAGSWFEVADPFREIAAGRVSRAELDSYKAARLPSLKDALEFTKARGMKAYVEIKDATGRACDPWIAERTVDLVREEGMLDSVIVQSFNLDYARRAKLAEPRLKTAALFQKRIEAGELVAILAAIGASSWNPKMQILDEATLKAIRAAGFDAAVWTVNDPRDMGRLLDWGATGIITDYPDRALALLD